MILQKIDVSGVSYYYLYHTITTDKFRSYLKCVGTKKPTTEKQNILKKKFLAEIKKNPEKCTQNFGHNVISTLQKIQNKKKYISQEDIFKLAKEKGIPATDLYGVATFYSQFKLIKPGKYVIRICKGTACHVKKSDMIIKHLEEMLNIRLDQTTKDGKYSLQGVNCIGACARAPCMVINGKVYGNMTPENAEKLVKEL